MTKPTLVERSGRYFAKWRSDTGKQKMKTLGTSDREEARRLLEALSNELNDDGQFEAFMRSKRHCKPSTRSQYRQVVGRFLRLTRGGWEERVEQYFVGSELAEETLRSHARQLRNYLRFIGVDVKILAPRGRARRASATIIQALEIADRIENTFGSAAVKFGFYTGLRLGEVLGLHWEHVNDLTIHIPDNKSNVPQGVPVISQVKALLDGLPGDRKGRVFLISRRHLQKLVREASQELGYVGISFHSLRHGYCTHLAEQGTDAFVIKDLARHASLETTLHYVRVTQARVRADAQKAFS